MAQANDTYNQAKDYGGQVLNGARTFGSTIKTAGLDALRQTGRDLMGKTLNGLGEFSKSVGLRRKEPLMTRNGEAPAAMLRRRYTAGHDEVVNGVRPGNNSERRDARRDQRVLGKRRYRQDGQDAGGDQDDF